MFEGVGRYNKRQVHLFMYDKVPSVAQKARRIPYEMREIARCNRICLG